MMKYTKRLLLFLMGAAFLSGCVREDRSECNYPLRLRFEYALNRENTDLFDSEVESLHLFLYDSYTGELKGTMEPEVERIDDDNSLKWYVPEGNYRVVTWAGNKGRYKYKDTRNMDEAVLHIGRMDNGVTVPQVNEHLFYGMTGEVAITGEKTVTNVVSLVKNTKNIRVQVEGLSAVENGRLRCNITASNGSYGFHHEKITEVSSCIYESKDNSTNGKCIRDFTIMSITGGDDSKLRVSLSDGKSSEAVIFDGSLSGLLLERPGTDLELDDEFLIRFKVNGSTGGLDIYVNDWKVVDMEGGLG